MSNMSNVSDISSHAGFRRQFPAVALPASFVTVAETLGMRAGNPVAFRFRRVACGTEVWLHFDSGFRLNLSNHEGCYPANVSVARKYAGEFARKHGFEYAEIKAERAEPGQLTKPERRELIRMVEWRRRYWQWQSYYKPENQAERRACDLLVARGLATEHVIYRNSYVEHNGALRVLPYFMATPAGVDWVLGL